MTQAIVSPTRKYRIPIYRVTLVREGSQNAEHRHASAPWQAASIFLEYLADVDRENFCVMMLTTKHKVIGIHTVSIGTLDAALAVPREVFKPAILSNAACVILCHNHPSGDPTPSRDDTVLTARLAKAGTTLGIKVLDHVIVGESDRFYAFSEQDPSSLRTVEG